MELEYYENEVVTKSGKRRLIYWNNSLIKDKEGQINELLSSGIDITDRKHSEEALIKIKDEFHLLVVNATNCMDYSSNGMNIYFNQQWVEYTGLTLEESYGELWIKQHRKMCDTWQENAVVNNAEYSLECRLRQKAVTILWLIRAVPHKKRKYHQVVWDLYRYTEHQRNRN
jgi:PAS domain-containing protein